MLKDVEMEEKLSQGFWANALFTAYLPTSTVKIQFSREKILTNRGTLSDTG